MGACPPVCSPLTEVSRGFQSSGVWCVVGRVVPDMSMESAGLQLRGQAAWPWRCTMTTNYSPNVTASHPKRPESSTRPPCEPYISQCFINQLVMFDIRRKHFYLQHHGVRYSDQVTGLDEAGFKSRQGQEISSPKHPNRLWDPLSFLVNVYSGSFPDVERPGLKINHAPLSNFAEWVDRICTPLTWLYYVDRDNYLFTSSTCLCKF